MILFTKRSLNFVIGLTADNNFIHTSRKIDLEVNTTGEFEHRE